MKIYLKFAQIRYMAYNNYVSKKIIQYKIAKLSLNEKINFFSDFQSYLGASMPLTTTLNNIKKHTDNKKIKEIVILLLDELDKGENFSDAILKFKNTIGSVYCNLMSIGVQSGELPGILKDIHISLKKQRTVIYTIIKASIYPAVLLVMLLASVLILLFFVAPRLANQYQNVTGEELTANMSAMQSLAAIISSNWFIIIGLFVAIVWGLIKFFQNFIKSELGVKFPVVSGIIKYYNLSNFSKILAISYSAGLPITHGILLACEALPNEFMKKKLIKCSSYITRYSLNDSFAGTGLFTPQMMSKLQAGEETGTIDKALNEISAEIDENLTTVIASSLQIIEPILMVIMAIFIIFYARELLGSVLMF